MGALTLHGDDCLISADELPEDMLIDLLKCGQPGRDASDFVAGFLSRHTVECDPATARAYLAQSGAWDDNELTDHQENLTRLVWIAGCDILENDEIYFCTY